MEVIKKKKKAQWTQELADYLSGCFVVLLCIILVCQKKSFVKPLITQMTNIYYCHQILQKPLTHGIDATVYSPLHCHVLHSIAFHLDMIAQMLLGRTNIVYVSGYELNMQ